MPPTRMSLPAGTRIGSYQIVAAIGAGGMGEVYRARDTRLDRDVAIKVLPDAVADDPAALARFERETKAVASLSHPNILAIHDVGRDGRTSYAVMELLQGESLRERLAQGALPARKAVEYGARIAHALGAAHERGVIHRDIKPDNIFITTDGFVKLLDFGLAKVPEATAASAAQLTMAPATSPGMVLGTVGYMSPEQVRGMAVDHRSDIFSLGAVLFEMLTGSRAFARDTTAETMTAILKEDPAEFTVGSAQVPAALERIVRRCLEKTPGERFHSAHDLGIALETLSTDSGPGPRVTTPMSSRGSRERVAWAVAGAALVALVSVGGLWWRGSAGGSTLRSAPLRMSLRFPANSLMHLGNPQPSLAVSPDGGVIVYTAGGGPEGVQLWVHSLDAFEPTPLAGTGGANAPRNVFFSPDGRHLAFFAGNELKRIPLSGGAATVLCEAPFGYGGTWTSRDEIVFSAVGADSDAGVGGLWRVSASGGERRQVATGLLSYPDALPDGRAVLASGNNPSARTTSELPIVIVDLDSGVVQPLIANGSFPKYSSTGHVVFVRNGDLVAAPIDPVGRTVGENTTVVSGVFQNPSYASGSFAVSAAGTLAYVPGTAADFRRELVLIDAKGGRASVPGDRRFFESPRLSPDGQRIAVSIVGWRESIGIFDLARGAMSELTARDIDALWPVWTPDGKRIVVASYRNDGGASNLRWMAADGSGSAEFIATSKLQQRPNSFSPDGKTLVFELRTPVGTDLWTLTFDPARTTRPLLATPFNEAEAAVSPSGEWMAYSSNQSGRNEIYLTRFLAAPKPSGEGGPSIDGRIQVSTAGGRYAVWSRDGRRLYYRRAGDIFAVEITGGASPILSKPIVSAQLPPTAPSGGAFDVMPDGRVLAVDDESAGSTSEELRLVVNWFGELRQKMIGGSQRPQ